MKLDSYLTPCLKTNSKWNIDPNIRAKAINILDENIGINPYDFELDSGFLDRIPKAQAIAREK